MAGKPDPGAGQERHGVLLALAGQKLGVGEPGAVIDGNVQVLPSAASKARRSVPEGTGARRPRRAGSLAAPAQARLAGALAGDAVADPALEAAELLGVEMDQLARFFPFVADRGRRGLKRLQAG